MANYQEGQGYELDWNAPIENDMPEFVVLPEGEYDFTVTGFERARHTPRVGGKLPPCNKAVLTLRVETADGVASIKEQLFLHSSCEGKLCAFFTCIGQRKHGEKLSMDWTRVTGARGRCRVKIDTYTGSDGNEYTNNKVARYLEPVESPDIAFTPGNF